MFKSCRYQKTDKANGRSDSIIINNLVTQGSILVCFRTKSNLFRHSYTDEKRYLTE